MRAVLPAPPISLMHSDLDLLWFNSTFSAALCSWIFFLPQHVYQASDFLLIWPLLIALSLSYLLYLSRYNVLTDWVNTCLLSNFWWCCGSSISHWCSNANWTTDTATEFNWWHCYQRWLRACGWLDKVPTYNIVVGTPKQPKILTLSTFCWY